jgi:type I restriction enzyme S subunit
MEATNEGAANQNYLSLMANIGIIPYEEKGDIGNRKPDDLTKCKLVKKGDLVINSMNYAIGSYGMSDYDGVCSPVYVVLRTREDVALRRFALRVFENTAFQKYVASLGNGILKHRAAIGWDDIKGINIPLPPLPVQQVILDFVDEATRKLDRLMALRQGQMDLLREQRAAIIQWAVTRGLNGRAPLKDSGLEWLGQIPKHWEMKPLKYIARFVQTGGTPPSANLDYYDEKGMDWYGPGDFTSGALYLGASARRISESAIRDGYACAYEPPVVLIVGIGASVGKIGVAAQRCFTNQQVNAIALRAEHSALFFANFLSSYSNIIAGNANNATLPIFNQTQTRNFRVAVPPAHEQEEIVAFIQREETRFNHLVSAYARQLGLLTEYRSALIHECVTGQREVGEPAALGEPA